MMVLVPQRRVAYTVIPKAANSTIKRYLLASYRPVVPAAEAMLEVQKGGNLLTPMDCTSAELRSALVGEDWLRFTFVRNPYSRLISVYKDKFLGLGSMKTGLRYVRRLDASAASAMPFRAFIKAVCGQDDDEMDAHWRPQSALLLDGALEYSHIGRVESFADDMAPVVCRLGLPTQIVAELEGEPINPTRAAPYDGPHAPRFDADLAAMVFERYRSDFDRFGYAASSWQTRADGAV